MWCGLRKRERKEKGKKKQQRTIPHSGSQRLVVELDVVDLEDVHEELGGRLAWVEMVGFSKRRESVPLRLLRDSTAFFFLGRVGWDGGFDEVR